ncbi:MAG: phosphatidylglycerophosphatase A [Nitrospirota bacterium]
MNHVSATFAKTIATVFFIGYLPFAPGTFGSLAGALFIWLVHPGPAVQAIVIGAGLVIGTMAAQAAENLFGRKDSGCIVIDEFVGYVTAIFSLPLTAGYMIAAFFLFRLFDIMKPPPIRNLERAISGGLGVMLDDIAAGVMTNILLQLWKAVAA